MTHEENEINRGSSRPSDPEYTFYPQYRATLEAALRSNSAALEFLVRSGDGARDRAFFWAESALASSERLAREFPFGAEQRRAAVIGGVSWDIYAGYKVLQERERWYPGLVREEDWNSRHRHSAARLLEACESLGGALIKAGQFASTRPDLLPAPYIQRLASLQDRLPPQPWTKLEAYLEGELGGPLSETFSEIDEQPLSAASISQVHRAVLKEDGREVAVKVQYPEVARLIEADLSAMESVFGGLSLLEPEVRLQPIADYLRWTLPLELDFRREEREMARLREALSDREDVLVPEPVKELTTERLLVMELMEGIKVTDIAGLRQAGIDPAAVAERISDLYADQLFDRGLLHADPHPGNILVQSGPRLVLLDHGLTLEVEPELVAALRKVVAALAAGDLEALAPALREADMEITEETDVATLLGVVGVLLGGGAEEAPDFLQFGRSLGSSIGDIPPGLLLVGRAIGLLDGITRQLAPELDSLEMVARRL